MAMPNEDHARTQLEDLSRALLRLHKALLDSERVSYERVHGRIPSSGVFLQLVLEDGWFAWLRPLSRAMAKLDELSDEDDASAATADLIASVRSLLTPSEEGNGFGRHYYDALQREPDVVMAHAAVRSLLRAGRQAGSS